MFEMFILSVIQSVTEFLPVSSSGHLILVDSFGFSNQTLATDVALHAGTLIAVIVYFHTDIIHLVTGIWKKGTYRTLFKHLCIATIPIAAAGFFGKTIIETLLRSPFVIAFTAIFFGILLWLVDKYTPKSKTLNKLTTKDAFCIGMAQVLALIPGTSRSGITITCARALNINRTEATRFSMLLSLPTIGLGALYILGQSILNHTTEQLLTLDLLFGVTLSAVFGLFAVWFLMRWVKTASFAVFAVYRVALGLFLIYYFL